MKLIKVSKCACSLKPYIKSFRRRVDTRFWRHASYVGVIYDTVIGFISIIIRFLREKAPSPQHPTFPLRLLSRNMQHFKTKNKKRLTSQRARIMCIFFCGNITLHDFMYICRIPSSLGFYTFHQQIIPKWCSVTQKRQLCRWLWQFFFEFSNDI